MKQVTFNLLQRGKLLRARINKKASGKTTHEKALDERRLKKIARHLILIRRSQNKNTEKINSQKYNRKYKKRNIKTMDDMLKTYLT